MSQSCKPGTTAVWMAAFVLLTAGKVLAAEPKPAKTLKTTAGRARALTFAPNGKSLTAIESVPDPAAEKDARGPGNAGGADRTVTYSRLDRIVTWPLDAAGKPIAFDAVSPADVRKMHRSLVTPLSVPALPFPARVMTHIDDQSVVAPLVDGQLRIWDLTKRQVRVTYRGYQRKDSTGPLPIEGITVSPDRKVLAVSTSHGDLQLWDIIAGKMIAAPKPTSRQFTSLHFTPNSQRIVLTGDDYIQVFSTKGKDEKLDTKDLYGAFASALLPDGNTLRAFVDMEYGIMQEYDLKTGRPTREWKGPQVFGKDRASPVPLQATIQAWFSRDGSLLLISSENAPFVLYDALTARPLARFDQRKKALPFAAFSADGKYLATTTEENNEVKVWEVSKLRDAAAGTAKPAEGTNK